MAAMRHKHGGQNNKYGKVTKKQIREVLFISQNMRESNQLIDWKSFFMLCQLEMF